MPLCDDCRTVFLLVEKKGYNMIEQKLFVAGDKGGVHKIRWQ